MLWVLRELGPTAPYVLADEMGVTKGAVSKLSERLCRKALVSRTTHKEGGRAQLLALTTTGNQLARELNLLAQETRLRFFGRFRATQLDVMFDMIKEIVAAHRASEERCEGKGLSAWVLDEKTRGYIKSFARDAYPLETVAFAIGVSPRLFRGHPEMMEAFERGYQTFLRKGTWRSRKKANIAFEADGTDLSGKVLTKKQARDEAARQRRELESP